MPFTRFLQRVLHKTDDDINDGYLFSIIDTDQYAWQTGIFDEEEQIEQITEDYISLLDDSIKKLYTKEDFQVLIQFGLLPVEPFWSSDMLDLDVIDKVYSALEEISSKKFQYEKRDSITGYVAFILHDALKRSYAMKIISLKEYEDFCDYCYEIGRGKNLRWNSDANPENVYEYCMTMIDINIHLKKYKNYEIIRSFIKKSFNELYGVNQMSDRNYRIGESLKKALKEEFNRNK